MREERKRRRAAATMAALLVAVAASCTGSPGDSDIASGAASMATTSAAPTLPASASSADPATRATAETAPATSTTTSAGPSTHTGSATTTVTETSEPPAGASTTDEDPGTEALAEPADVDPVGEAVDPLTALQAVDWRNDWYSVYCPGPERTGVQLVDGEFRPTDFGMFRGLGAVQYGEIADGSSGRRTVAAVDIRCAGASHFPSTWLLYGAEPDGTVVELGVVAGGAMTVTTADPSYWWEANVGVFVDGLLHLRGNGYSRGAAHCCPDYDVYAAFALGPDGPVEVAHHEIRDLTVPTLPVG